MYFHHFVIISPWKRAGPFIWTNLNPLHRRMPCAKFGWNWISGSGEEDFKILSMYFHYFIIISPWKKGGAFHLKKTWIPFTQIYLVQSLVEIGPVVLEKKMFKRCQFIFIISKLSPLWEGLSPSFEQTWIPFTQEDFVPSLVEIGPVVLEKKMKMWKVYRQTDGRTDGRTDDGRQVIRKAHF